MAVCKGLEREIKNIAESMGVDLEGELLEHFTDKIEEFILDLLQSGKQEAENSKRKTKISVLETRESCSAMLPTNGTTPISLFHICLHPS